MGFFFFFFFFFFQGKTASMLAADASRDDIVKMLSTLRPKRKSTRRHSTGKHQEEGLTISTVSPSKSKPQQRLSASNSGALADEESGSSAANTPRHTKEGSSPKSASKEIAKENGNDDHAAEAKTATE